MLILLIIVLLLVVGGGGGYYFGNEGYDYRYGGGGIGLVLLLEVLHARHADQPGGDSLGFEHIRRVGADVNLGSGGDENQLGRVGLPIGVAQHVRAALNGVGRHR